MPKTIRMLKNSLLKAGCVCEQAKGSHTKWSHDLLTDKLILSGHSGADAKPYQEKQVAGYLSAIAEKK